MRYRFEPVPGKEFCFAVFDKESGEPFNIAEKLNEDFAAGKCADKKVSGYTK